MAIIKYLQKYPWAKEIIKLHFDKNVAVVAPYHNFNHTMVVTENVIHAAHYYDKPEQDLVCAALWHDFNHTQGRQVDKINVQYAKDEFLIWWKSTKNKYVEINPINVLKIIDATQYNGMEQGYEIPAADLTLEQKIIRDADLLQYLEKNRISQVYLGLSFEMNVSLIELLQNAPKFINSIIPNTDWMKRQWEDGKQEILEEFKILIDTLK